MASTYSTLLRFELPTTGEQAGNWGNTMDTFMGTLLEHAIAGALAKILPDADYTLTTASGSTDEARYQGYSFTGTLTAPRAVIFPSLAKHFYAFNSTTQTLTLKTATGGVPLPAGNGARFWCDGTTIYYATLPVSSTTGNPTSLTVPTANFATLGVSGVTTLGTTPSAATPLVITANTGAVGLELKGRAADSIGILRFMNTAGATELARLQSGAGVGTLTLAVGTTPTVALAVQSTGAVVLPVGLSVTAGGIGVTAGGIGVTAGGITVAAGGASISGDINMPAGDLYIYRNGAPGTGVLYLGNTNTRYLFYDGANYQMNGAALYVNGGQVYTTGNFNPAAYMPLGGGTFTGTTIHGDGQLYLRNGSNRNLWFQDPVGTEGGVVWNDVGTATMRMRAAGGGNLVLDSGGNLVAAGNVSSTSDRRLKQDFAPLEGAAELVAGLADATSWYRWKDRPGLQLGFLAQDVERHLPAAVAECDGFLNVADRPILAATVKALALLQARVSALEAAHG